MDTFFASPIKSNARQLAAEIEAVSNNPLVSGLLRSVSGLLAILDENRQITALNDSLFEMLAIENPEEALGLRPGGVPECVHAGDGPSGCGIAEFCSTCGAAVAIVSCLEQDTPFEKRCTLSANRGDSCVDLVFLVGISAPKYD